MAICNGMGLALKPCTSGQEQGMLLGSSTSSMSRGACSSRNYMPVHTRASELEAEQTARHRASHITTWCASTPTSVVCIPSHRRLEIASTRLHASCGALRLRLASSPSSAGSSGSRSPIVSASVRRA